VRTIAIDYPVAFGASVSMSVTWLHCAKTAKRIEVRFGTEIRKDAKHFVLGGDPDIPTESGGEEAC